MVIVGEVVAVETPVWVTAAAVAAGTVRAAVEYVSVYADERPTGVAPLNPTSPVTARFPPSVVVPVVTVRASEMVAEPVTVNAPVGVTMQAGAIVLTIPITCNLYVENKLMGTAGTTLTVRIPATQPSGEKK